jgi:uncharacterized RDD family membrane protein YckC
LEETIIIKQEVAETKELAGFWLRFAGNVLDGVIISTPLTILLALIITGNAFPPTDLENPMPPLQDNLATLIFGLYGLLLPVIWKGYTLGKKLVNVKIVRIDGQPLTVMTMFMRNFVAGLVYVFTLGIAGIVSAFMVAFREDKRSIHDLIAKTEVIKVKK